MSSRWTNSRTTSQPRSKSIGTDPIQRCSPAYFHFIAAFNASKQNEIQHLNSVCAVRANTSGLGALQGTTVENIVLKRSDILEHIKNWPPSNATHDPIRGNTAYRCKRRSKYNRIGSHVPQIREDIQCLTRPHKELTAIRRINIMQDAIFIKYVERFHIHSRVP